MNAISQQQWADHLATRRPCLQCPLCGSEIPVEPHVKGRAWSGSQDWFLLRMRALGTPWKVISAVFGGLTRYAVEDRVRVLRKRGPWNGAE